MKLGTKDYLIALSTELSRLYGFARQMNELDFAGSLGGEFRGMQDAGWATTITAQQVFEELQAYMGRTEPFSLPEMRIALMLYCQLSEAGGVYESLKNIMGVVTSQPYNLWPFKDIVRVRKADRRVIAPNANATFKDLATKASEIGMTKLASLLALAFNDEIRNGISHADYVIWNDGLRLRKRNGGYANRLSFEEVGVAITVGVGFYDILQEHNRSAMASFNPARQIIGKFSLNFPMRYTVFSDPERGAFSISTSSPGPETTPEYLRQVEITARLGGKVLAVFPRNDRAPDEAVIRLIEDAGYDPHIVPMDAAAREALLAEIDENTMHDERGAIADGLLLASPFGFRSVADAVELDQVFPPPTVELNFDDDFKEPAPAGR
ncbi:hypothetical protein N2599_22150 (plasmid) [Rhizobium sullae]|uniref:Uncharacterized protein n=1 Tax=Rhizobium sullae TaxID=50338 RepID=A0ABY5XTP4_RHISU|nr:hypothetical protein [Rhizobium sullae]UWU18004.1 hypothetical protein N2599_22150 [Rhizobium sullae]